MYNLVSDYGSVHLREVSVSGGSAPLVLATQYNDSQQCLKPVSKLGITTDCKKARHYHIGLKKNSQN